MASKLMDKAKDAISGHKSSSETVTLAGHKINSTGYGLMLLTWGREDSTEQSIATMKAALEAGANFWNAGTFYGTPEYNSLHLLKAYFTKYPEDASKVVLSIKGGIKPETREPDGSPESVRSEVKYCNEFLAPVGKKLDIFECARVDPNTPIEITMKALEQEIAAGNLGAISLSETSAASIRRAAKVAKIAAVEVEVSLWATEIFDNGVAKACAENDIVVVAYSPLGRGFLTGSIKSPEDLPEGDLRKFQPRFQPGNFEKNMELVDQIKALGAKKGATPGQIALAWVKAQSKRPGNPVIVPIPGTSSQERLKENMTNVELSDADMKEIDSIVHSASIEGGRYPPQMEALLFGDSPELTDGAMEAAFARK